MDRDPLDWLRAMEAACRKTSNLSTAERYKSAADEIERLRRAMDIGKRCSHLRRKPVLTEVGMAQVCTVCGDQSFLD